MVAAACSFVRFQVLQRAVVFARIYAPSGVGHETVSQAPRLGPQRVMVLQSSEDYSFLRRSGEYRAFSWTTVKEAIVHAQGA
jgi:hypothetical protein